MTCRVATCANTRCWNEFAPRIGMTFDLSGTGKTILKANYGYFIHNPGAGVGVPPGSGRKGLPQAPWHSMASHAFTGRPCALRVAG